MLLFVHIFYSTKTFILFYDYLISHVFQLLTAYKSYSGYEIVN